MTNEPNARFSERAHVYWSVTARSIELVTMQSPRNGNATVGSTRVCLHTAVCAQYSTYNQTRAPVGAINGLLGNFAQTAQRPDIYFYVTELHSDTTASRRTFHVGSSCTFCATKPVSCSLDNSDG